MSEPTLWRRVTQTEADAHYQAEGYTYCPCHEARLVPVAAGALLIEDWEWLRRLIVKACERYGGEPRMVADAVVAAAAAEGRET